MASSALITILARTDNGLRLIPALRTPSSKVLRDALREAFTCAGSDPAIAEAFDLAAASDEGVGFPIALAAVFGPTSPGVDTTEIAYELPELHTDITEMLRTLAKLTADRDMDDVMLFVSYE